MISSPRSNTQTRCLSSLTKGLPGIDVQSGLNRVNRKEAVYLKLLKTFLAENTDTIEHVKKHLRQNQREQARILIHGLKGVSGNISAYDLHKACKQMELALKNNSDDLDRCMTDVHTEFTIVLDGLNAYFGHTSHSERNASKCISENAQARPRKTLNTMLMELDNYLKTNNTAALRYLDSMKKHFDSQVLDHVIQLENYILIFDYDRARGILSEIAQKTGNAD